MTIEQLIVSLLTGLPITAILLVIILLNPEKIEKWSALLFRLLSYFGGIFKGAHRQYLKHDLQGRINGFIKILSRDAPYLASERISVQWIDPQMTRKSFIEHGDVVIRLRRDDTEDENFVHGSYLFVSSSLLYHLKRYISPPQRKAVDLYVTTKLLEKEKPSTVAHFLDDYLHPQIDDTDTNAAVLFDKFAKIDHGGFFYPVFLQELHFLGHKVFGRRRDDLIASEVSSLVDFLVPLADREAGHESNLDFTRRYCRFSLIIVGKRYKVTPTGDTYVSVIKKHLLPERIETIYILGQWKNQSVIINICNEMKDQYETTCTKRATIPMRYGDRVENLDQFIAVLRLKGIPVFQPSE